MSKILDQMDELITARNNMKSVLSGKGVSANNDVRTYYNEVNEQLIGKTSFVYDSITETLTITV